MALIATATTASRKEFICIEKPKEGAEVCLKNIVSTLKTEGTNMNRVLIFCRTYNNVIAIYQYFRKELGEYMTYPPGSPNFVVNRTGCLHPLHT